MHICRLLDAGVALVDSTGVAVQTQRTHSEMVASQVSKYTQQLAQMSTQHSVRHRTVRCVGRKPSGNPVDDTVADPV